MTRFWHTATLILATAMLAASASCGHPVSNDHYVPLTAPAAKVTTPELVRKQQDTLKALKPKVVKLRQDVDGLSPENLEVQKGGVLAEIGGANPTDTTGIFGDVVSLTTTTNDVSASVAADTGHTIAVEKENTAIKDSDRRAQQAKLNDWGLWILIISLGVLALSFAVPFIPTVGPFLAPFLKPAQIVAAAGVAVALALFTLATFIVPIEIAIAIAAGAGFLVAVGFGVAWLVKYARGQKAIATDIVQSIDAGKAAGQIVFTPDAKDPNKSVVKAFMADTTTAFVNAVQGKPNLTASVNGPGNVSPAAVK